VKECSECHQVKSLAEFYRQSSQSSGLNPKCKVCVNEYNRAYHEANRIAQNRWKRISAVRRWAKKTLGISPDQLWAIELRADGRCELCGRSDQTMSKNGNRYALALDHDHVDGKARAMLCRPCNTALGCAQDDPALLRRMANYLENPPPLPEPVALPARVRKHSPETRAKMAAAATGRSSLFKGQPRSEEVRRKISRSQLGKKRSEEARANMRAARLRYLETQFT
jgi:ubiquitin